MKKNNINLLRNKVFRILAYTTTISSLGDSLYALAITLSVYNITGSLMGVAGMWLIRALIRIPCQFFSGVIVDRFDKRKISIYVYLLSAMLMFAIVFTHDQYLILAFFVVFILQGTSDVDNLAQMGIMSEMISEDDLTDAENIFSIIGTIVLLIGPGLGAVLYKHYGTTILYAIDGITFVIAAFFMAFLPYKFVKEEYDGEEFTLFSHAKKGLQEVKNIPIIQYTMILSVFFGMMGRFYEIDKVYLADSIFNIGAEGIIYFEYAMAIGGMIAPFITLFFKRLKLDDTIKYSISCIIYATCFMIWGCAVNLKIALISNILIGVFETSQGVMTNVIFMSKVRKNVMGMVMAYRKIIIVFSAICGAALAPVLVDICGVPISFIIVCGSSIIISLYIMIMSNCEKVRNSD